MRFELTTRKHKPFRLVNVDIRLKDLPKAFDGYRFVQLTDLHLGSLTSHLHIQQAINIVKEIAPNLVVLTGDYVHADGLGLRHFLATHVSPKRFKWMQYRRTVRALTEDLARLISDLSPPDGIIAITGNHEYLEGVGTIRRQLENHVTWLINASRYITRQDSIIQIAGVDDVLRGRPNLERAIGFPEEREAATDSQKPFLRILLSHNPDIVLDTDAHLLEDIHLVLSGHTHGGQICLPLHGPILTHTQQKHHVQGLSSHRDTAIYVSSGIGFGGLPLRLFCPPEITVFTLRPS